MSSTSIGAATRVGALSQFATGLFPQFSNAFVDFLSPVVTVGATFGYYQKFDDFNAFQSYDALRAVGGPRKRITFLGEPGTYDAKPYGLEVTIDDIERKRAGENQMRLEQAKVRTLLLTGNRSRARAVVSSALTALGAGTDYTWNSSAKPIDAINAVLDSQRKRTGRYPNRMVIGPAAWLIVKDHPNVISRITSRGSDRKSLTMDDFAAQLLNPQIKIMVPEDVYNTAKEGQTVSNSDVLGSIIIPFLAEENMSEYDPSFMKTFASGAGVEGVNYRREDPLDVYSLDWDVDNKVTGSACAVRMNIAPS